jgi:hypothetical protein
MADDKSSGSGPASNYRSPSFTEKQWRAFEKIIGAKLNHIVRIEIEEAAEQFTVARYFEEQDKQRRGQRGKVDSKGKVKDGTTPLSLLKTVERLLKNWSKVRADSEAKRVIEIYCDEMTGTGKRDLETVICDLQFHQFALSHFLQQPKGSSLFNRFVGRLAVAYEKATGMPPTIGIPKDSGDLNAKVSPFVELVAMVSPHLSGVDTPVAKSQAVKRALDKYKSRGKKPPKK